MNKIHLVMLGSILLFTPGTGRAQDIISQSGAVRIKRPAEVAARNEALRLQAASMADVRAGKYTLAESEANQSLLLCPGMGFSEESLAESLAAEGKIDLAFSEYSKMVVTEHSNEPREVLPYALMLLKRGQFDKAVEAYNLTLPFVGTILYKGHDLLVEDNDFSSDNPDPVKLEADLHIALGFTSIDDNGISGATAADCAKCENLEYSKALSLEPKYPLAQLAYDESLGPLGKWNESWAAVERDATNFTGDAKEAAEGEHGRRHFPVVILPATPSIPDNTK